MSDAETLKIDTAFPGLSDRRLSELLSCGWQIVDKTVLENRYIYYVLQRFSSPNEQSDHPTTPND